MRPNFAFVRSPCYIQNAILSPVTRCFVLLRGGSQAHRLLLLEVHPPSKDGVLPLPPLPIGITIDAGQISRRPCECQAIDINAQSSPRSRSPRSRRRAAARPSANRKANEQQRYGSRRTDL